MKDKALSAEEAHDEGVSYGLNIARENEREERLRNLRAHSRRFYADILLIILCFVAIRLLQIRLELKMLPVLLLGAGAAYLLQRFWKKDFTWTLH